MTVMQTTVQKSNKWGFTLIEILVAITIIGILATIGLRSFTGAQTKSRDARRKSDLAAIQKALEVYYNDFGQYPLGQGGNIVGCADEDTDPVSAHFACTWGSSFDVGDTNYMLVLPADPSGQYYYMSNGLAYILFARLENLQDSAVPVFNNAGTLVPGRYSSIGGYSATPQTPACRTSGKTYCNYVVTSSNTKVGSSYVLPD